MGKLMWKCHLEIDTTSKFDSRVVTMFHTTVGDTKDEVDCQADLWLADLKKQGYVIVRLSRRTTNMSNGHGG